ncbi:MAG: peptidoglycan-binding domain-containing protein, partial [Paracoccaceae bacterium]
EATGFLNAEQIASLSEMAAAREAELEEERRAQAQERERADRAYWEDIGRGQDEAGLRAYLERFPDGSFSDVASARLSEIETVRDRAAWESAEAEDTQAAYRDYLDAFENGAFADRARARLAEMTQSDAIAADEVAWAAAQQADTADAYAEYLDDFPGGAYSESASDRLAELTEDRDAENNAALVERAREEESTLGLNPISRSLVEMQLLAQGFNPGQPDGQLDDSTRQALRGYQDARGLPVTGYVDRQTLNRLIGDGLPMSR